MDASIIRTAIQEYSRDRIAETLIMRRILSGSLSGVVEINGVKYTFDMHSDKVQDPGR